MSYKNGWRTLKLGDVLNFRRGYDLPKEDMIDGEYPVVGSNGIIGYHNAYTTESPCVTIGRSGNVGNPHIEKRKCWAHNTTLYIDDFKGNDEIFLYYFLHTLDLMNYRGGSAVPTLNRNHIHPINVTIPPLPVQRRIAAILSSLDDKIENNRKICEKLEEIAQAIFKRWFVDFEFSNEEGLPYKSSGGEMVYCEDLGKEIPKGWECGSIGDYCSVKSGYAFKSSWWQEKGIPVIKIKGIYNNTIDFSQSDYVDEEKAMLASDFIVNGGDLLIAMTGATIGKIGIVPFIKPFALVNQRVGKFFLGNDPFEKLGFIYNLLLQPDIYKEIVSRGEGSAQPNISPTGIMSITIVLPDTDTVRSFNQLVEPLYRMNIKYQQQNSILMKIRDALLPKLMSGEIEVDGVYGV